MNESSAEHRKSASSTEQHKSTSSAEQHKSVSSVEQIKSHIDSPFPKAGICNFSALSTQKALAPNLHVNVSEISEEHKGATDCSSDKTIGDTNIAPSSTQHSLPEVINLDPEIEVERNTHEVKDLTDDMAVDENNIHEVKGANDDMAVDEPLEKQFLTVEETDAIPICGIDATTKTCLTVVKPSSEMNGTTSQNATQVLKKEVSVATGTGNVPVAEGDEPELMMVERNSTTDEGLAKFDPIKTDPTSSTDLNLTREMKIPETSLLAGAEVISADSSIPAVKSSEITNITLESGVPDEGGVTHEVKTDVDLANANPA
uniref:Uncharacterized protein n=1 Tax=Kalanchoe fedtschenkoi TaxID=63787 RepID=A0A7N0V9H5_KALFE